MGDHTGIRKKLQPQLPDIDMYSPPQYAVKAKKTHASPMHANFQSHGVQSHQSILGEASPKVQVSLQLRRIDVSYSWRDQFNVFFSKGYKF